MPPHHPHTGVNLLFGVGNTMPGDDGIAPPGGRTHEKHGGPGHTNPVRKISPHPVNATEIILTPGKSI